MADPLSISAGAAGLISLGIQVTQSLVQFYTSYKNQDSDVARTTENIEILLSTFENLHLALQSRTFRPGEEDLVKGIESHVHKCDDLIQELKEEIEKLKRTPVSDTKEKLKVIGRRAAYPFRESTLKKLDEDIGEIRDIISLALDVLQLRDHKAIQDDTAEIKSLVEAVKAIQISSKIHDWLKAPDATINHNASCAKRHPGTGAWFVKGPIFTDWLTQDNSFLWLNGFAGSGKSVLCSTAIQHTFRHKRSDRGVGIAFFYFTFNDESKKDESAMLRALLIQLAGQCPDFQTSLARLHGSYHTGTPPAMVLLATLRDLIGHFNQVYLLLDGVDESPQHGKRDQVLDAIEAMRGWGLPTVHILATSRNESDIRASLAPTENEEVVMKNNEIDEDIRNFISGQLKTDRRLKNLSAYHDRIRQVLAERAQGVFRWVECQFDSLRKCPRSEKRIEDCLQGLPRNLDETYERILRNIDEDSVGEARRILTLLCFSVRPLTVLEVIDGIAVDIDEPAGFDVRRRLQDVDDLCKICPGLIDISIESFARKGSEHQLRIAHFSVQEYLESDRIHLHRFSLKGTSAHAEIAQVCLIYLLEVISSVGVSEDVNILSSKFPLHKYTVEYWDHHYKKAVGTVSRLEDLVLWVFQERQDLLNHWKDSEILQDEWLRQILIDSPISSASWYGLDIVLTKLLGYRQDNSKRGHPANAQVTDLGNALQAASYKGHIHIIKILLAAGADIYAQNEVFVSALQAASLGQKKNAVQFFIDAGVVVNTQGGGYGNALQAACNWYTQDTEEVVRMLIDGGADVNAQGGYFGNALQAALLWHNKNVVQILINVGADVNTQGGLFGNALQAASMIGYQDVVQILIDAGADVNAQGGEYGNALQAASSEGNKDVVQILIEKGADVNARGGGYGNALQAASSEGDKDVVQILIEKGADVNAQGGCFGNALQAASYRGHKDVVQILIEKGADVNAQGGEYGNALQAASYRGHKDVVQILIEKGADVNARGGKYGSVLKAASRGRREGVIRMLIDAGAVEQEDLINDSEDSWSSSTEREIAETEGADSGDAESENGKVKAKG